MTPICYAVALGCNTVRRLAREWGISHRMADYYLKQAAADGLLVRIKDEKTQGKMNVYSLPWNSPALDSISGSL